MPAVPGTRRRDPVATRRLWAERLERFGRANQTVAQFCAAEGVSVPSFYVWKRTLAGGTALTESLAAAAGDAAASGATPLPGNAYKVDLVRVVVKRALLAAGERR